MCIHAYIIILYIIACTLCKELKGSTFCVSIPPFNNNCVDLVRGMRVNGVVTSVMGKVQCTGMTEVKATLASG